MNADEIMQKIFEYSSTINNCCAFVKECVYTGKCRFDKEGYKFAPQCTEREVFQTIKDALELHESLIRCKDCQYYGRVDKRRFYRGEDCINGHISTIVPQKDFCSRAEGKKE